MSVYAKELSVSREESLILRALAQRFTSVTSGATRLSMSKHTYE